MRRNTLNRLLLIAVITLTIACKAKKAVVVAPAVTGTTEVSKKSETLKMLKSRDVSFNTLSLRGKARIDINGSVNNVSISIRMKKDEMIWLSITAIAGIEVARARITPDSLQVMNRMQGVYLNKPFSYVHGFANKQVNFKMLQSILSGNTIDELMVESTDLKLENGVWLLSGEQEDLGFRVLFNTLLKVGESNLNDVKSGQALKVVYGDYQKVDDTLLPTAVQINSMAGTKKIAINFDFSKFERNLPAEFPFNVPSKYEVLN